MWRLTPDDARLDAVLRVIHAAYRDAPESPSATMLPERLQNIARQGEVLVISEEDTPVACVITRPSRDFPGTLYLGTLAVAPEARGQGLARRLMAAVMRIAHSRGEWGVSLDTWAEETRLIAFYGSFGFEAVGEAEGIVAMTHTFPDRVKHSMSAEDPTEPLIALIRESFAYMDGRVDPPSSMHRLNAAAIAQQISDGEIWIIGAPDAPEACVFFTPHPAALYIGKLAVAPKSRRRGLARTLMKLAETRARALGFDCLTLQSRIELSENHKTFRRLGFTKTAVTAHEGYNRPTSITFEKRLG
ncbi:GNAT family N-acetyltransferase [Maritimibacter dapengensis]|uniref:GNAT family N-acetyltransferase n=1 Tax=Maritimibacter dapengensis TaxID=2836868 RepID=A0ABS6SWY0_9RHOB|nr:GNAT family N-acetyltransferase [Maritimibacter dapengensis]